MQLSPFSAPWSSRLGPGWLSVSRAFSSRWQDAKWHAKLQTPKFHVTTSSRSDGCVLNSNPRQTTKGPLMTPAFLLEPPACHVLSSDEAIFSRNGMSICHHKAGDCSGNFQNTLARQNALTLLSARCAKTGKHACVFPGCQNVLNNSPVTRCVTYN